MRTQDAQAPAAGTARDPFIPAGADFVKTSTGFTQKGATVEAVALMRKTVGPDIGVKASGGVRSFVEAMAMGLPVAATAVPLSATGRYQISPKGSRLRYHIVIRCSIEPGPPCTAAS